LANLQPQKKVSNFSFFKKNKDFARLKLLDKQDAVAHDYSGVIRNSNWKRSIAQVKLKRKPMEDASDHGAMEPFLVKLELWRSV